MAVETATRLKKINVLGLGVSHCTYASAVDEICRLAQTRTGGLVTASAVHLIMEAHADETLREALNQFAIITPDGQPVRWALNWLGDAGLTDRVYGPDLLLALCTQAAREGIAIFLYGSTAEINQKLRATLLARTPDLIIAGSYPSRFREDTSGEFLADEQLINDSGAGMVFVGLGCPRQERWAFRHRGGIKAVQICVGAAFAFHAGMVPQAPGWMQRLGLEWVFRLGAEPRRLWRRYLFKNPHYLWLLFWQRIGIWRAPALPTASTSAKDNADPEIS